MPRTSHVVASLKRKKRIFKKAKGFWGGRSKLYKTAIETVRRGMVFSYRDRRDRKSDFRQLWIVRINAALRSKGTTYSRFINQLKKQKIELDRKILAQIAYEYPKVFDEIIDKVQSSSKTK